MIYLLVIEFPDAHASIRTITAEDIGHAALIARGMIREHPVVLSAFLAPKALCTPLHLPRDEQR